MRSHYPRSRLQQILAAAAIVSAVLSRPVQAADLHPLDGLSDAEYLAVTEILRADGKTDDSSRFALVDCSLHADGDAIRFFGHFSCAEPSDLLDEMLPWACTYDVRKRWDEVIRIIVFEAKFIVSFQCTGHDKK